MPISETLRLPETANSMRALMLASGVAMAALLAAPAVGQTDAVPAPSVSADEITEAQLEAFADAAMRVAEIRDEYQAALAQAESEAEQQELVAEGNNAMLTAVEDAPGITIEEYIIIGEAAAANPELGDRLAMMIETRMAE